MKPKIHQIAKGLWECFSEFTTAVGRTPREAYDDWSVFELGRQIKSIRKIAPQPRKS